MMLKGDGAVKKSKFTEEQIAFALKQADAGTSVEEVCRKMGVSYAPSKTGARSTEVFGLLNSEG